MNSTANEKLVNQYFEHFNKHEWAKLSEMYIENAEFKDPSLGLGIVKQTRQQFVKKYAELQSVFPNLKDRVVHLEKKNIIVEFISTGTAEDGCQLELPICTIFTIENGKITKDFTYYDNFNEEENLN
jgi:ketosteroid isomerase-like protein